MKLCGIPAAIAMVLLAPHSLFAWKYLRVIDFETGDYSQTWQQSEGGTYALVTKPTRCPDSKYSSRQQGGKRSEIYVEKPFQSTLLVTDQSYWYGGSYYGGSGISWQGGRATAWKFRSKFKIGNCNPINTGMTIRNNGAKWSMRCVYDGGYSGGKAILACKSWSWSGKKNDWNDIIVNFCFSDAADKGFLKVWCNGKKVVDYKGVTTLKKSYPNGIDMVDLVFIKNGTYYGSGGVVHLDEIRLATGDAPYEALVPCNSMKPTSTASAADFKHSFRESHPSRTRAIEYDRVNLFNVLSRKLDFPGTARRQPPAGIYLVQGNTGQFRTIRKIVH